MKKEQILQIEPLETLSFKGPFTDVVTAELKLKNPSNKKVAFKVKTTAPRRYCVRPNSGILSTNEQATVQVMLQPFEYDPDEKNRHKFMVQTVVLSDGQENHENLWKTVDSKLLMDTKLKCVFEQAGSPATGTAAAAPASANTAQNNLDEEGLSADPSTSHAASSFQGGRTPLAPSGSDSAELPSGPTHIQGLSPHGAADSQSAPSPAATTAPIPAVVPPPPSVTPLVDVGAVPAPSAELTLPPPPSATGASHSDSTMARLESDNAELLRANKQLKHRLESLLRETEGLRQRATKAETSAAQSVVTQASPAGAQPASSGGMGLLPVLLLLAVLALLAAVAVYQLGLMG